MRPALFIGLWCIINVLSGCGSGQPRFERFEFTRLCMGVQTRVVVYGVDAVRADNAARAAFAEIDRLEQIMSDYRPDSELMRLCAVSGLGPKRVSSDLRAVLERAIEIAAATDGAFDPTLGPLTELWREARRTGAPPDPARLAAARARTGWRNVSLGRLPPSATLLVKGMKLDLGGIGKGFAAERAVRVLRALDHAACLVALAGDVAVGNPPPEQPGWRIAVAGTDDTLLLRNTCVSTSGDTEQFVEIGGVRYAHILDPATGLGVTRSVQATVVAPEGAAADALATALCVLPRSQAAPTVAAFTGAEAMLLDGAGDAGTTWRTTGWFTLVAPPANADERTDRRGAKSAYRP